MRGDERKAVGVGERGEIFMRGPQICTGYWRKEKATKELLQGGWLKPGGAAVVDERGWIWIVDRKKASLLFGTGGTYANDYRK